MVIVLTTMTLVTVAHTGDGDNEPTPEQLTDAVIKAPVTIDPYAITDLIYAGRVDSALIILNSDKYAHSSDPLVYLLRARAIREKLPDEDNNKDLIKQDTQVIHAQLDSAIALCEAALEQNATDPIYQYYRGRAYLGRAQMHTLTRSYWSAGRSAGQAKGSLEEFLKYNPDHADAQGDLGAFLYFSDTLPGVIKFFSKLLRFPSGSRERGIEMLRFAASHDAVFHIDYKLALIVVDLLFEGRFDRGTSRMQKLIDEHPGYTRLVEPYGVISPLAPFLIREFQRVEDEMIATRLGMVEAWTDWSLIKRVRVHRAYADMYFKSPNAALAGFSEFIDDPADRPDWLVPLAIVNRGQLYAKMGRTEEALSAFAEVLANDEMDHFHDLAGKLTASLDEPWKIVDLDDLEFIGAIYDDDLEVADIGLKEYGRIYGRDVIYFFYLGEIATFRQNFAAAQRAYSTCLDIDIDGGDQSYQMFSALRLAELYGLEERYGDAKDLVGKARGYIHVGYLLDFMIHSRQRYFELMDEGTLTEQSPLLLKQSANRPVTPQAVHK